ncbi:MAG: putative aminopeptidase [Bacteroidetes bacterium HLUCCA01]|nr:MAG: putative aminopeptidase [Bacteroidetes bacterium HLUCCA01]
MKAPLIISLALLFMGCGIIAEPEHRSRFELVDQGNIVPPFSADSAYSFIQKQVEYGPRNPNSEGHRLTRDYLVATLKTYAGESMVYPQHFQVEGYEGEILNLTNVIAAFNPQATDRIMLSAHWDTRPRAEEDYNATKQLQPILGADDGGSGVGILLELARIMAAETPPVGVDIVLFDGEDYGHTTDIDKYFLGSRHWASNPPVAGYNPRFGILLDIVGSVGATFPKEGYSRRYAPTLTNNIWTLAATMELDNYFLDIPGGLVADDHLIVNEYAGIPMVNIIHYTSDGNSVEFPSHWHTHMDNMDVIDKQTIDAVGRLVTEIIYNRITPETAADDN